MIVLELLGALVGQLALDLVVFAVVEVLFRSVYQQFRPVRETSWWVAALGSLLTGALVGIASTFLVGQRLLPSIGFPGMSLIVAPIIAGAAVWGVARFVLEPAHLEPSPIFTWWGGALFAFAVAAMRFTAIL